MRGWARPVFVALLSVAVFVHGDALWAQQRPLRVEELKTLAAGGVTEKRLLDLVKEKGIGFSPTAEVLEDLRRAGVPEAVIEEMTPQVPSGRRVNYYIEKGYELLSEGEAREAIAYFQKVLEMEPGNIEAANGIEDARWELEEGEEMDAAVEAVLRAEQISSPASGRGWLGIAVADSPPYSPTGQPLPPHVTVMQVLPGSPAAQAGIRAGDVILGVQGQPVQRAQDGVALIRSVPPGTQARIELFRAGQFVAVNVIRGAGGATDGRIPTQPSASTPAGYPPSQPQAQPQSPQQTSGAVIINGRKLMQKQVQQMTAQYGFPPPAGRYWYDSASGLYGIEGREAIGMIRPGHDYGPLSPNASNGNTNLVVNGRIINSAEYAYLQQVFGVVFPGRYWLDGKTGNYGVEGNRMPLANLYVIMQQQAQRRGGGSGYRWRDGRGSIAGTEGSCTWISVPGDSAGARMYGCD